MVPYFEQPVLYLGNYAISAYGVLAVAGTLVALGILHWRATKHGIEPERAAPLFIAIFGASVVGSHIFEILAYQPEQLARDPWVLLRITEGQSSFGGLATGMLTLALIVRLRRWSAAQSLRFLDLMTWCFVGLFLVSRLGCALAHDHIGPPSTAWLAVAFPDGPRLDLGLLEWLALWPVALLFLALDRRERAPGLYAAVFMLIYGSGRLLLDFWRVDDARYWGLTPGQFAAAMLAALGLVLCLRMASRHLRAPSQSFNFSKAPVAKSRTSP